MTRPISFFHCSIKAGKIVILLNGRYAGRKAVVVRTYDEGHKDRKFGHALVVGIDRYPRKTTKAMSKEKIAKRQRIKPFIKFINYNHIMPTRYNLDLADKLKTVVSEEALAAAEAAGKEEAVEDKKKADGAKLFKDVKVAFEDRFKALGEGKADKITTGALYFFRKLTF